MPQKAELTKLLLTCQKDELTGHEIYKRMAHREKNADNKQILLRMSREELEHAKVWQGYTGKTITHNKWKVAFLNVVSIILGYTFVVKTIQKDEAGAIAQYGKLADQLPEAAQLQRQEQEHENALIQMLDEERLEYVGSMVLGLNDALVELTGAIAGLTFAMANTRLVALSGIITGISATFSMAASNYLAERANGNPKALKSSLFTGVAYLVTVVLLVLPYLLFPETGYVGALATMLVIVVLIILVFNYYVSVAKSQPFLKRFGEMAAISLGVAALSFVIGLLAKELLGIDVA